MFINFLNNLVSGDSDETMSIRYAAEYIKGKRIVDINSNLNATFILLPIYFIPDNAEDLDFYKNILLDAVNEIINHLSLNILIPGFCDEVLSKAKILINNILDQKEFPINPLPIINTTLPILTSLDKINGKCVVIYVAKLISTNPELNETDPARRSVIITLDTKIKNYSGKKI